MNNIDEVLKGLGRSLAQERLRLNQTQSELAVRAKVSRPTISKMEKGEPGVSIGMWARVLDALSRAEELKRLLQPPENNLFERLKADQVPTRRRARKPR